MLSSSTIVPLDVNLSSTTLLNNLQSQYYKGDRVKNSELLDLGLSESNDKFVFVFFFSIACLLVLMPHGTGFGCCSDYTTCTLYSLSVASELGTKVYNFDNCQRPSDQFIFVLDQLSIKDIVRD